MVFFYSTGIMHLGFEVSKGLEELISKVIML